ncbi:hypothetical protein ACFQJC_14195 [Haloferax namakaokahaiae]|uniref:Uncharacterized protein n=1 Tax=Haloferax namakaokahaiae TaxID=1748331 RepID=A0ABD5ZHK3_9EURY
MVAQKSKNLFLHPVTIGVFVVFLGGFVASITILGNPYLWPFTELGRQTSFAVGCRTLGCLPLTWGIGLVYTYLFSVVVASAIQRVR